MDQRVTPLSTTPVPPALGFFGVEEVGKTPTPAVLGGRLGPDLDEFSNLGWFGGVAYFSWTQREVIMVQLVPFHLTAG